MLQEEAPRLEIKHLQRTPSQEREQQLTSPERQGAVPNKSVENLAKMLHLFV
jgi:hypothetical protein